MNKISRRNFVKTLAMGSAVAAAPLGCASMTDRRSSSTGDFLDREKSDFCFVHLTDPHVRSKRKGDEGYRKCIQSIRALHPKPEMALMGGDLAFDGNYTEKDEFIRQIDLYKTISDEFGFPYYNCIGNHDALGWSSRRKVPVDDPDIGKKLIMDKLGMDKSYYSFDYKGWHFAILDSLYPVETESGPTYEARMGEEQLEWLAYDLGTAGDRPKICVTHVAAFYNISTVNGNTEAKAMAPGMVVKDTRELRLILERHKVKALLQGHSHSIEDYQFNGVWYLTGPAVSAAWWGGNWLGFEPGYRVFYCKDDHLTWECKTFDWPYYLEPEDTLEKQKNEEREIFLKEQEELRERERAGIRELQPVG